MSFRFSSLLTKNSFFPFRRLNFIKYTKEFPTKSQFRRCFQSLENVASENGFYHHIRGYIHPKNTNHLNRMYYIAGFIAIWLGIKTIYMAEQTKLKGFIKLANLLHICLVMGAVGVGMMFRKYPGWYLMIGVSLYFQSYYQRTTQPYRTESVMAPYEHFYELHVKETILGMLTIFTPLFMMNIEGMRTHILRGYGVLCLTNLLFSFICDSPLDFKIAASTIMPIAMIGSFVTTCKKYPMSLYSLNFLALCLIIFSAGFSQTIYNYRFVKDAYEYPKGNLSCFWMCRCFGLKYCMWFLPYHYHHYVKDMRVKIFPIDQYFLVQRHDYNPELHVTMDEDRDLHFYNYKKQLPPAN